MSEPRLNAPAAVEVRGLRKTFGTFEALKGVTFTVPSGSFTTLLGASGSGKTTCLRLLAGLEVLDGGEIQLGEAIVSSHSPALFVPPERRQVGLVHQSYALWPHMNVFDHVAYPLRVRRQTERLRERVESALRLVDLTGLGHRYPSELSGGQQQRVAMARAVVYEPSVLLLDEPLSNLDAELRGNMRRELQQLHRRLGLTMVYVTHDQSEALALSDQVIVMHLGRIIDQGRPHEIYERPGNLETARFVGSSNLLPGRVIGVNGTSAQIELDGGDTVRAAIDTESLRQGEQVMLGVKPEDIALRPEGAASVLGATVENVAYVGSHSDLAVRLNAGATADPAELLRIRVAKWIDVKVGDPIEVAFRPDHIRVFKQTEEGTSFTSIDSDPGAAGRSA